MKPGRDSGYESDIQSNLQLYVKYRQTYVIYKQITDGNYDNGLPSYSPAALKHYLMGPLLEFPLSIYHWDAEFQSKQKQSRIAQFEHNVSLLQQSKGEIRIEHFIIRVDRSYICL